MDSEVFEKKLTERAAAFEEILKVFLPKEAGYAKTVIEAMNYSLLAGGNRIRPVMMMEAYKLFSKDDDLELVKPFMCAMEMIHT